MERKPVRSLGQVTSKSHARHDPHPVHTPRRGPTSNKVSAARFEILGRWAEDLGLKWVDVLLAVHVPKTTAWKIPQGAAGVDVFSSIERYLVDRATRAGQERNPMKQLEEWTAIGLDLAKDRPESFAQVLATVRAAIGMLPPVQPKTPVIMVRAVRRRSTKKK